MRVEFFSNFARLKHFFYFMLNIVIFGGPGSGKGTQSDLIIEKYNLKHVSTGDLLRDEIAAQTKLGITADSYISKGQLVPDELVINIIDELIKQNREVKGFIFDGFPRTITQGKALDIKLTENGIDISRVICLDVDEEVLIERLLNRGKYSGRSDDNRETIEKRLKVYHQQTEPLVDYYQKQNKLSKINGNGDIDSVFKIIEEEIDNYIKE